MKPWHVALVLVALTVTAWISASLGRLHQYEVDQREMARRAPVATIAAKAAPVAADVSAAVDDALNADEPLDPDEAREQRHGDPVPPNDAADPLLRTAYVFNPYDGYDYFYTTARDAYLANGTDSIGNGLSSEENLEYATRMGQDLLKCYLVPKHTHVAVVEYAPDGYTDIVAIKVAAGTELQVPKTGEYFVAEGKSVLYGWANSVIRKGRFTNTADRLATEIDMQQQAEAELDAMMQRARDNAAAAGVDVNW